MIKPSIEINTAMVSTAARLLIGLAALAAAATSIAGCSTTANAAGPTAVGTATGTTSGSGAPAPASTQSTSAGTSTHSAAPTPAPSQAATTQSGAQPAGSSRCHTSDLSASFTVVDGSAGMGNISYNLRLTNISAHECTIYGFAGMLLLDANHKPLPTNVIWDSLVPKQLVHVSPGGSAAATVRFSPDVPGTGDNGQPPPGRQWTCQPTSHYTEVTPPDETTQLVTAVSPPTPVCERGTLQASAFIPGPTGPNQ